MPATELVEVATTVHFTGIHIDIFLGETMKKLLTACCAGIIGASMFMPAAHAKEVKVLFSFALPPYVIKDAGGQEASGFEFDILKAALAAKGHTVKPVFVAMGAIPKM